MKTIFCRLFLIAAILFVATPAMAAPIVAGSFSTTWDSLDGEISINLGDCPTSVYWEEVGNEINNSTLESCDGLVSNIEFPTPGQYRVDYSGSFNQIDLQNQDNRDEFRSVEQWGDSEWSGLHRAFADVTNLTFNAVDTPNLSSATTLSQMFAGASNFNSPIENWDVSNVTDMQNMFDAAAAFNQPLNSWNISNAYSMNEMFEGASSFNQPLDNWDLSETCQQLSYNIWNFFFNTAFACIGDDFTLEDMFADSGIDTENYSRTLQGWSELSVLPQNTNLGSVPSQYCDTAQAARDVLIANGWMITDEGVTVCVVESNNSGGSTATRVGDRIKIFL